jgi:hypothetical protein
MDTMDTVQLVLVIVALVLAVVEIVRSQGQSLVAWAAALLAVALILPRVS